MPRFMDPYFNREASATPIVISLPYHINFDLVQYTLSYAQF